MVVPGLDPFILFSPSHIMTMVVSFLLFIGIPFIIVKNREAIWINFLSKGLGLLLIGNEWAWLFYKFNTIGGHWAEYLPLEMCTVNAYLLGWLLLRKNPSHRIFEVVYFWGLAGTVQGIVTPRLFAGFPQFLFWEYFITHTGVVLAVIILIFRHQIPITVKSLFRAFLWLQVIAIFNLVVDFTFEVNYMFMREFPEMSSIIDFFGPWPWYIFVCELFGLFSFSFYLAFPLYFQKSSSS